MRQIIQLIISVILLSCTSGVKGDLKFKKEKIVNIEVFQGYPGEKVEMKSDFKNELIKDLNNSKEIEPTKYMKTHRILIRYKEGNVDTLLTNGTIHQFNGWHKSDENLIEKYSR